MNTIAAPAHTDVDPRIRQEWENAATPLPELTVPALFARHAAETPGAIAVETENEAISYAHFSARADRLARRLVECGVTPGDHVAVLMRRSPDLLAAFLAVAKAGAAFVPLEPRDPLPRMRSALAGSGCALLLTDATTHGHEITEGVTVVCADAVIRADGPDHEAGPFTDRTPGPDALLYIMHTSGSTGQPKGVAVTHRNVVAFALDRLWCSGGQDRTLFHCPHTFDASTLEIWVSLLSGGTVVIAPGQVDAAVLRRLATGRRVTRVVLIAGLFGALADADPACLDGVRQLWIGGDVVPPAAVERVHNACPDLTVYTGYGPTEATTIATRYLVPRDQPARHSVPIGTSLDNTRVYVLDEEFRLLPPGEAGELYIAGDGVARGYVHQPGLTAQRFLPDPFGAPGERMYATGDLARREDDGNLSFLGRADDQVKIQSFRIEPGEIESVLAAHPEVIRAVVVAHKTRDGSGRLSAFAVPAGPGTGPDPELLRRYLADRLPAHMVPAEITIRADLPLTAHDKVDRKSLLAESSPPAPDSPGPATASASPSAASPTASASASGSITAGDPQAQVAALWTEVLGIEHIGPDENFFDCGGNSLKLIGLHARLCRTFDIDLPVQRLFEISTIRAITRYLQAQGPGIAADPGAARPARDVDERGAARRDRIKSRKDRR